jgi:hypothetical protein
MHGVRSAESVEVTLVAPDKNSEVLQASLISERGLGAVMRPCSGRDGQPLARKRRTTVEGVSAAGTAAVIIAVR